MYSCWSGRSFAKPASMRSCEAWKAMKTVATMKSARTRRRLLKIRFSSQAAIASLVLSVGKILQRQHPQTELSDQEQLFFSRVDQRLNACPTRLPTQRETP